VQYTPIWSKAQAYVEAVIDQTVAFLTQAGYMGLPEAPTVVEVVNETLGDIEPPADVVDAEEPAEAVLVTA
jgi:hypothetical protein